MKKLFESAGVLVAAAVLGFVAPANAATIPGLFNTGVNASGVKLAVGAVDTHYVLNGTGTPFVYSNSAYPIFSDAGFLAAQANGGYTINPNVYTLTFSLAGLDAATASLSGTFFGDDTSMIMLNGITLATNTSYNSPTAFSATSGFLTGNNVLSVSVLDIFGAPSGFLISGLRGSAAIAGAGPVPEPASWAMMVVGFGVIGSTMRARRKAVVTLG